VLIILLLQVLQQHLLLIRVQLVQVDHHVLPLVTITVIYLSPVLLPILVLLYFDDPFLTRLLLVIVALFRLINDVLLHDILLQLTHLLRIQFETHLLSRSDQVWVNRCVATLTLIILLIIIVIELVFIKHLGVVFLIAAWVALINDLLNLMVSLIRLTHQSLLRHLDLILIVLVVVVLVFLLAVV
jgi:hypothetical protein